MPNATDQPTDRPKRGTLFILVLAGIIAVGLWYWQTLSENQVEPETPRTAETTNGAARTADSGTTPPADTPRAVDSGTETPTDVVRTTDSGTATATEEPVTAGSGAATPTVVAQTTDPDAATPTEVAGTTDPDTATPQEEPVTAGSGAATPTEVAGTTDPDATTPQEEPVTAGSGAATPTEVASTTDPDTATPTEVADTTDPDAATPQEKPVTAGSGAATPTEVAQTTDPDAATPQEEPVTAGSDAAVPTGVVRTADSGTATAGEEPVSTGSDAAASTEVVQTPDSGTASREEEVEIADSGATAASGTVETAHADTVTPIEATRFTDSGATESAQRIAAVEPPAAPAGEEIVLSPVPESSVERVPVEAPTGTDMAGETGILATIGRTIERLEAVIQEHLSTESDTEPKVDPKVDPEVGSDSELRVRVTYDDAQEDAAGTEVEPKETLQSADSPAPPPPADTRTADSGVEIGTTIDESAESGGAPPADATRTADSDTTRTADSDATRTADPDATRTADPDATRTADSDATRTADSDATRTADSDATRTADSDATRTADSDATRTADSDATRTADSDATRTADSDATRTADSDSAEAEAEDYVETLTETAPQTIPVDKADHFVTPERVVSLVPEDTIESVSVEELAKDETLSSDTPITVVREVEQIETAVPEQLIAESGGDLDQPLRVQVTYDDSQDETEPGDSRPKVVEADVVEQITVREALERMVREPEKPVSVIKTVRYFEVMTLKELLDSERGGDGFLTVVTQPYRIESATLADLLQRHKAENPDSIFYLRTVLPTDDQGIWGIIHFGLIENFARGMAIRRGEDIETYTVEIPRHADERLGDRSSSFLGRLIDRKTKDSYVYNYRENRMGRNPDRIYPGQELVIINFELEELKAIHKHFASS